MNKWMIAMVVALASPIAALAQPAAAPQHAEVAVAEAPSEDTMSWNLNAGGVFNSGNTRSWTMNAGTKFAMVRGRHGLSLDWVFAYGRAALRNDMGEFEPTRDVARNSNARLRYDFFLTDNDALFVAVAHRWDTFAGLDTRLQGQLGYLRNIFNEENHRLWGEIGGDITYDNFDPEDLVDAMGAPLREDVVYSARLYLAYKNQLNEHVLFTTGLEALLDLQNFTGNTRLVYDAGLNVTVVDSLSLGIAFKLLYDQEPVQGRETVDTITTLNLMYSLL